MISVKSTFNKRLSFGNLEANLNFLLRAKVLRKGAQILEIGSGLGTLLAVLCREGYDIRGTEINEALIERSREIHGNLPLSLVHNEELPFDEGSFDIVVSFDVFEHIPNSEMHLDEVRRVLRANGYYLLQTPNKLTNVMFETLRWKSFTRWKKDHCSLHTFWALEKRFRRKGFEVAFFDIPVVNEFFKNKIKKYAGPVGLSIVSIMPADKLPIQFRPNLYLKAKKGCVSLE